MSAICYIVAMIPPLMHKLFWDIDPNCLDTEKNKRIIISRTINYGTLTNWRWLTKTYGKARVAEVVRARDRSGIRESARRLANILFV